MLQLVIQYVITALVYITSSDVSQYYSLVRVTDNGSWRDHLQRDLGVTLSQRLSEHLRPVKGDILALSAGNTTDAVRLHNVCCCCLFQLLCTLIWSLMFYRNLRMCIIVVSGCKMVNGSRYYRTLESVSIASALSTALTIYPCQIRVHQRWQSKLQLLTAQKKKEWWPATVDCLPQDTPGYLSRHRTHNLPIASPARYQ